MKRILLHNKALLFTLAFIMTLLLFVPLFSACNPKSDLNAGDISVTDSTGYSVAFDFTPTRVVALQASVADVWLLAGGNIVGVSDDYLDYGLMVENVTVIGETHYTNEEYIISLNPDLVIYSAKHDKTVVDELKAVGIKTFGAEVENFSDYLFVLGQFCKLTGRDDLYQSNGLDVKEEIDTIISTVPQNESSSVLFLRTRSAGAPTVIAGGHFVCELIKDLGATNVAATDSNEGNLTFSMEEVINQNPDFILITFMGVNNVTKSKQWLEDNIFSSTTWQSLDAVKNDKVVYLYDEENLDRAHLFQYKPNARWAESYQYLYDVLYPA